jgi:hypothetical protein
MSASAYRDGFVEEALLKSLRDRLFMILLDDPWCRRENAEGRFSLAYVGCLAELKQNHQ